MLPAAIGIIYNPEKTKILLIRRCDIPIWVLPGGGIEPDESPEQAVIREIWEETGYRVAIERQCAEYTPTNKWTRQTSVFVCTVIGGQPKLSSESSEINFFLLSELPSDFFVIHREWLEESLISSEMVVKPLSNITFKEIIKYTAKHPWQVIRYAYGRWIKKN